MKRFKHKGVTLAATAIAIIAWMFLSYIAFVVMASPFPVLSAARTARQAEQYAEYIASSLKLVNYDDLGSSAHARRSLANEINGANGWESRVSLSGETTIGSNTQRIATIDIFRQGDTLSRCSLQVPLSSASNSSGIGFPDYSHPYLSKSSITSFTMPINGIAYIEVRGKGGGGGDDSSYLYINGKLVKHRDNDPYDCLWSSELIILNKNDVCTASNCTIAQLTVFPLKK